MFSKSSIPCAIFVLIFAVAYVLVDQIVEFPVHDSGLIILTGATAGLGKDAAIELTKLGYTVLAGARSQQKADALRAEIADKNLVPVVLEVTNSEHIQNLIKTVDSYDMPLVAIVNNAGIADVEKVGSYDMEKQRKMYDINVIAPVELVNVFWSRIVESAGRIVNIGSCDGESSSFTNTYAGTKAALKAITHSWRRSGYEHSVSVSLILPGATKSNMCPLDKFCDSSPKDTTTPAYVDAITNPRPKSVYITGNLAFIPSKLYLTIFKLLPLRVSDYIINAIFGGPDVMKTLSEL